MNSLENSVLKTEGAVIINLSVDWKWYTFLQMYRFVSITLLYSGIKCVLRSVTFSSFQREIIQNDVPKKPRVSELLKGGPTDVVTDKELWSWLVIVIVFCVALNAKNFVVFQLIGAISPPTSRRASRMLLNWYQFSAHVALRFKNLRAQCCFGAPPHPPKFRDAKFCSMLQDGT